MEDGWWEDYEVLRRKYELGSENGSVHSWKEKIKKRRTDEGSKQQEYFEVV